MPYLKINHEKVTDEIAEGLIALCPFGAMARNAEGKLEIGAACKTCRLCVNKGPKGVVEFVEDEATLDRSLWHGICVFAENDEDGVRNVVFELLGKARELAKVIDQPVYALWIGSGASDQPAELIKYGADRVYVYDSEELRDFSILPYAAVFQDFVEKVKPGSILVGATNVGRSLGPRIAARLRTGMTADCTRLEMKENSDLVQIRPAFGGNIMARIVTEKTRPQFCTVREKVFSAIEPREAEYDVVNMQVPELPKGSTVLKNIRKAKEVSISEAETLVVAGRGVKSRQDLAMIEELADALGAEMACTRPLVEAGWFEAKRQIGLSGRTVKPKLIITCGVSGAVQFAAGMKGSDCIVSINSDKDASIFDVAHIAIIGDIYKVVPRLIRMIKEGRA